jgi:phospholipase C
MPAALRLRAYGAPLKMTQALLAAAALTACGGAAGTAFGPATARVPADGQRSSGKIAHVVVIVQENRSVDNLFQGFPGADTQPYGYNSKGQKVTLQPIGLETSWDIDHSVKAFFAACDGTGSLPGTNCKMDGFDKEALTCSKGAHPYCPPAGSQYGYVPQSETKPYFALGKQYVLADHLFSSNLDGSSYTSHQYLIAGQADSAVNFPSDPIWGCDGGKSDTIPTITQTRTYGPSLRVCFNYPTLGDEMDAAGVSWSYYTSGVYKDGNLWNAYQAIKHIRYGVDWKSDVKTPQTRFFKDITNGVLPAVSWVTPVCATSDHSGCGSNEGPAWVASLVNAIGTSKYWDSTAIFVVWDDYGGWYDHVAPQMVDYDGLGMRSPMLVVSPYAKQGYVSKVPYEWGSILKFIEDQFGLPRLAASDTRATSPAGDCFNFSQSPRAFKKIPSKLGPAYFMSRPPDPRPVDTE